MLQNADQTLNRLRRLIADGTIGADGRMPPERHLADELGVGRRSLRRALDILEQEGRITREQGRGTFVHANTNREMPATTGSGNGQVPAASGHNGNGRHANGHIDAGIGAAFAAIPFDRILEFTNPIEVSEVRLAVEPVIARLAALRASQADIRRLELALAETKSATDPEVYEKADEKFHRIVAEAARNALFLSLFDTFGASRRDATWRRLSENAHCFKRQAVHAASHQEIYDAIAARNSERAYECMYRHLSDIQRHIYTYAFPQEPAEQRS
ncbi:FadR/GntR family transcriptional regulator [Dongia sp.]|uniref:FadR/GntR family transcriptional regulator n=1 Tax=Dongia sp. TaxID=1977262 RepID=UPI0035B3C783